MKRLYLAASEMTNVVGQKAVADLLGESPQTVNNWEARGVSKNGRLKAQEIIGCNAIWVDTGNGSMSIYPRALPANTAPGPAIAGHVPVISWVQAGAWSEIIDNFTPGDAEEWLPCPVKHSDKTFVLRVRGESMFNPHGRPSFQEGDLIFVDPERPAENGSLVVVRLDDAREATFKKLVIEGEARYLRALNPAWPESIIKVDDHASICGVVIFKGEKL